MTTPLNFTTESKQKLLFRVVHALSVRQLLLATAGIAIIGVLIIGVDNAFEVFKKPAPYLILFGSLSAIIALKWATCELATTLKFIRPAFLNPDEFDVSVREALNQFPSPIISALFGLPFAVAIFGFLFWNLPLSTSIFLALLCLIGGEVFSFGLFGYIWSYQLIWKIHDNPVDLFHAFRLRKLSAYGCTLALIGIVPAMITWQFYVGSSYNSIFFWLAVSETVIVIISLLIAEMAVYSMFNKARLSQLALLGDILNELWAALKSLHESQTDNKDQELKAILEIIHDCEGLRQCILGYRCKLVPWDAIGWKIMLPILIGVLLIWAQVYMKEDRSVLNLELQKQEVQTALAVRSYEAKAVSAPVLCTSDRKDSEVYVS